MLRELTMTLCQLISYSLSRLLNVSCPLILMLTFLSAPSLAVDIKEAEHHHPYTQAVGVHGMAIFSHNNTFYASHMPLLHSIHAHQVVFSFTVAPENAELLTALLKQKAAKLETHQQAPLISLLPEPFDLIHLIDNEITTFTADVYQGHFERSGEKVMKNIPIKVEKLLLVSNIHEGANNNYYLMPIKKNQGLLIHKIGQLPSFDQIVLVDIAPSVAMSEINSNLTTIKHTSENTASEKPLILNQVVGSKLKVSKLLYLETQDFTR